MSSLQSSLLAIGGIVVVGVLAFNWVQERGFRRRTEKAFSRKHDDVLLRESSRATTEDAPIDQYENNAHIPLTQGEPYGEHAERETESTLTVPCCDPEIDDIIELNMPTPISAAVIQDLLHEMKEIGKPVSSVGLNPESNQWEEIALNPTGLYQLLKLAIQLVNRNGPISSVQLSNFRDIVNYFRERNAVRIVGLAELPLVFMELIESAQARETLGRNALAALESQRGATARTVDALVQLMHKDHE